MKFENVLVANFVPASRIGMLGVLQLNRIQASFDGICWPDVGVKHLWLNNVFTIRCCLLFIQVCNSTFSMTMTLPANALRLASCGAIA